MELPYLLFILIGVAVGASLVATLAWHRRRDHALRDRFEEEYARALSQDRRDGLR